MNTHVIPFIVAAVLLPQSGCGPRPVGETGKAEEEETAQPANGTSGRIDYPTPPPGMPFHGYGLQYLAPEEEIRERHEKLFMKPLPDYAIGLAGWMADERESNGSSIWAFIVPQNKIQDFRSYLVELGVPEEYLDKEAAVASMSRPLSWRFPDPPATDLILLESLASRASVRRAGLEFVKGQTWIYLMENPNLGNSFLQISFDPVTGNTRFLESYYDARAAGDFYE
jgi:hypothetical protein